MGAALLQKTAVLLLLVTALLISSTAAAKPPRPGFSNKHDFKACGGAKACLGTQKLNRIRRRAHMSHKTVDQIAHELDNDEDLALDTTTDMLIYSCAGIIPDPQQEAVVAAAEATYAAEVAAAEATAAAEAAAAAAASVVVGAGAETIPVYATEAAPVVADAATEVPHHHHHHHHHHHRKVLQTATSEIANPWTPDVLDQPIDQVSAFTLHSRPNAVKKIYLDFDGHVTQGTAWNSGRAAQLITPAYDKDGSPSTWSAAELADILAIWRGVSEDFAPWDVDVTTEDPGEAYLQANGVRAAIGGAYSDWYGASAGGVAYVGVFGMYSGYYSPAFIFAQSLSNNAKYIWEAVSHEVGHTLGLSHDGTTAGVAYYAGTPTSPKVWAPIMGASYYSAFTQWSKGEYAGANNLEDDIAIISGKLGYVTDIHGNSMATAVPFSTTTPNADGVTAKATAYGIIRGVGDIEYFAFTATAAGPLTVTVEGAPRYTTSYAWARSDLMALVTLRDTTDTVLAQALTNVATMGVATGLSLNTQFTVPAAGQYYITIKGSGNGVDPYLYANGFSDYASQGQYKVTAVYPFTAPQPSPTPSPSPSPTPSPSPSPIPSPSPSPTPSPSPSPVPSPSPSPSPPSPSPSPSPQPVEYVTFSFKVTGAVSGSNMICTARITVVKASDGVTAVPNAVVQGEWSTNIVRTGWPYTSIPYTSSTNVVTIKSTGLPTSRGTSCSFKVTGFSVAGFALHPSIVLPTAAAKYSW